ncbi:MAG: hypothetical protein ABW063_12610 [Caulobacter sp.]
MGTFLAFAGCAVSPTWAGDLLQLTVQGKSFTLTSATAVSYGANNVFTQKTLQPGTYSCDDAFFGDPLWGVVKACYMPNSSAAAAQLQLLANQFSSFTLAKTTTVSYGVNGTFNQKTLAPGTYACSDGFFGDPVWGLLKACYAPSAAATAAASLTPITGQFNSFRLTVATTVSYGANGVFVQKTLQPGTYSCDDGFFGDPLWGVTKACYATTAATPTATAAAPATKPVDSTSSIKATTPASTTTASAIPGDVVVNGAVSNAEYQAMAQKMGTDAAISYRYGMPSTAAKSTVSFPGPRPNQSMQSLAGDARVVQADGIIANRACRPDGWCGQFQLDPGYLRGWSGDYSANIANIAYVPDSPVPAGFLEKRYHGVASLQTLNVGHNVVSIKPEPSWTTWIDPSMNNADNDENTVRLAGVRGGSPIGTIAIDDKPVACQRGYGRGGWTNNVLCVFANGSITSAGSNTSHNFLKYSLPAGKTPTALAISNSGEFALITVWDTAALRGQVAVLALSDACQWCETKPESQWNANWGNHRQAYPGLPGLGNYFQAKLVGFVDLPESMRAPTEVALTTGKWKGDYERVQQFFDDHLLTEAQRKRFYDGDLTAAIPRTGMAVVVSKSEKKAAFIDLRPLFQYYRAQYLTPNQAGWNALIASRGQGASQWPYTFDVAPAQRPTLIKVVDLPASPTAVQMSRNAPHRALIATVEGKLRVFDLGARYLDQGGSAVGAPSDIAEKFTLDVGANPTSIAYFKEKAAFGKNGSLLYGREGSEERYWWALSREERKATLFQFDAAMTSAKPIRVMTMDPRIADPIAIEDNDNHGTESHILSVADYTGRQLHNVMYAPMVMWTYDAKAPCTETKPCAPLNGAQFEYAGSHKLPGRPFQLGIANIN